MKSKGKGKKRVWVGYVSKMRRDSIEKEIVETNFWKQPAYSDEKKIRITVEEV